MNSYAEYDAKGQILRILSAPHMEAIRVLNPALGIVECTSDENDASHFVLGGVLTPKPERPSLHHIFDYTSKQWQDPRTLQDLRDAKWAQVKQSREAALTAPLVTPYGIFDANAAAQDNITRAVLLANNLAALGHPVAINFTLFDNSVKVLDEVALVQVGLLLGGRVQLVRDRATALREQIEAATTAQEIDAITWDSNA